MTNSEAFYIIGNMPIPIDDENYNICQYQEAKAIALDCIDKIDKINEVLSELEEMKCEYDCTANEFQRGVNVGATFIKNKAIDLIRSKLGDCE